jgi:hypothetical protein
LQDAIHQDDEKEQKGLGKKCGRVKPPLFLPVKKCSGAPLKRLSRYLHLKQNAQGLNGLGRFFMCLKTGRKQAGV